MMMFKKEFTSYTISAVTNSNKSFMYYVNMH